MVIIYKRLLKCNLQNNFLDEFQRFNKINKYYKVVGNEKILTNKEYVEDWNEETKRRIEKEIIYHIENNSIILGAFINDRLVGFILVSTEKVGKNKNYNELKYFHVSNDCRGKKIGRNLFEMAIETCKLNGINKLYLAANPSYQSQKAYEKLGCTLSKEIIKEIYENEKMIFKWNIL